MKKIHTADAAEAIGPYSQGVVVNNMLYSSGQIALTAEGTLAGEDIDTQTHQVFSNLKAILKAAGASLDTVIKTTIFLKNMDDFARFNELYGEYFDNHKPARSCVEVSKLPKNVKVEIELIALVK